MVSHMQVLATHFSIVHNWASEASPTLGCSIKISCDIYMYVGMSVVCQINCVGGITWPTGMLKVFLGGKDCDTRVIDFDYVLEQLLAWTKKKRSLRNEKLKANRASDTEEQRKERLRIEDKTQK